MMMKNKKKIVLISIIGVAFAIVLFVIGFHLTKGSSPISSQEVYANQESQRPAFIMAGKVEAIESADISVKASGKIQELNVDVGSVVKKGAILGRIDMKEVPAQVNQAQSTIDIANVNLNNAENSYNRTLQLYESGAVSKEALESAEKQLNTATAQLNQAQSGLELIQVNSSNGIITAPIAGTVTAKSINVGEMAAAGSTLMSIVNPEETYINAYLPARLSGQVQQGQKVIIRISEIPDQLFNGEIALVDSIVDAQNKNILVRVNMLENEPAVKVGMFAEIALKK